MTGSRLRGALSIGKRSPRGSSLGSSVERGRADDLRLAVLVLGAYLASHATDAPGLLDRLDALDAAPARDLFAGPRHRLEAHLDAPELAHARDADDVAGEERHPEHPLREHARVAHRTRQLLVRVHGVRVLRHARVLGDHLARDL